MSGLPPIKTNGSPLAQAAPPVSPSIPAVGSSGVIDTTLLRLSTALSSTTPQANGGLSVSVSAGNGAPTFKANTGSMYHRNDTGIVYVNTSASPSGNTWTALSTTVGTVTSVTAGIGINTTGTAAAPVVNLNAFDNTGALLSGFKFFSGT